MTVIYMTVIKKHFLGQMGFSIFSDIPKLNDLVCFISNLSKKSQYPGSHAILIISCGLQITRAEFTHQAEPKPK